VPVVHAVTVVITVFSLQILRPLFTPFQLWEIRGLEARDTDSRPRPS